MKKRFFKPYVGSKYDEGIHRKKILVIGASFPCELESCPFYTECTDEEKMDSSKYDEICPYYKESGKKLSEEPSNAMSDGADAYNVFGRFLADYLDDKEKENALDYIVFTNFIQFFIPHRYTYGNNPTQRDFDAFMESIEELNPDVIIVWGTIVNSYLRERNPYVYDIEMIKETEWYLCHMKNPSNGKIIPIINPYHPMSRQHWYNNIGTFKKYFEMVLNE
ncbi:MAG: hypothetical protein KBT27_06760 [Prevotellaceae bacterium]|nr:hypothetical protein [Candidatus Faecinaster equi]